MDQDVIIIGAGMAGLSAGAYLQMNGFQTRIFEANHVAGGVCTSWKRGDYVVDLCIHWLVGSGPTSSFYDRWSELIDMDTLQIVDHEEFFRVEDEWGHVLRVFTNIDRLEEEMLSIAPHDEAQIKSFTGAVRKLSQMEVPTEHTGGHANIWHRMQALWKVLPYMGVLGPHMRISARDYAKEFSHPLIRKAIENLFEPETAIIFGMMTLAWMHNKAAGYPIGGSMRFAQKAYHRYRNLGGTVQFGQSVTRILTENGRAAGVQLANGEIHRASWVVSAADGYQTLHQLLEGRFQHKQLDAYFKDHLTFPAIVYVAIGIGRSLKDQPHAQIFPIPEPLNLDPQTDLNDLPVRIHHFDPTLAPEGKTLVTLMLETRNDAYWYGLKEEDPGKYESEKQRIAQGIIGYLEGRLGNFAEHVEMVDVATPATFIRFTNNWRGSFEGWLMTPGSGFSTLSPTLEDLSHFYMCGHWIAVGGGLPAVLLSGRNVAEAICHDSGRPFHVSKVKPGETVQEKPIVEELKDIIF